MFLYKRIFKGDARTVKAKRNILASVFLKGVDSLVYLLLVPVTLGYLNPYEYGIWLTLNSILMWINSFDIGLGNGLRNKLAQAVAIDDKTLGKIYVSTTFIMLILIMGILLVIGTILTPYINWYEILGTTKDKVCHLDQIVYYSFVIFSLNFVFKFIGNVYLALQLPAINNLIVTLGHLLSLIVIYVFTKITSGNLFIVALIYTLSPLLIYLVAYPITFYKVVPWLRPSLHCFRKKYLNDLLNLGIQFFLLQLSGIVLFSFGNILISHKLGPENVTPYNIAYRYFSLVPMALNIILSPYWSATTDAYTKNEISWILSSIKKIYRILLYFVLLIIAMILFSKFVYYAWIGNTVEIPYPITLLLAVYFVITNYSIAYSSFLNGLGKLRIQTINTVIVAIIFYPLCSILLKLLGLNGIIIGMILLNISGMILNRIQFKKVISGEATGLWNK